MSTTHTTASDAYMSDLGQFSPDGTRYTIRSPRTPHGWTQYVHNECFLACLDANAVGESFYRRPDGTRTRLILNNAWPRRVYVRDQDTGEVLSVPGSPGVEFSLTPGLAEYAVEAMGLSVRWTLACPDGLHGEAWRVCVENASGRARRLLVVGLFPLLPNGYPTSFGYDGSFAIAADRELAGVFFDNHDPDRPDELYNAFFCQSAPLQSFDTSSATFLGDGDWNAPAGLRESALSDRINCSMSCHAGKLAALASEHDLPADGTCGVRFVAGVAGNVADARAVQGEWLAEPAVLDHALASAVRGYRERMDRQQIRTPEPDLDRLANHWLGYNLCFTARWTRLYSRGFRDCMQDTQGVATLDAELARANLLEAMPHVYRSGRCRRAWAAGKGALLEQYYADQPIWVAPAFRTYLAETGDTAILDEVRPWFDGGEGTVWEHLLACQRHLHEDRGEHGLCRIHDGDWCDTAHRLGVEGRGEGVWLSMAHHKSLLDFIEIAEHLGRSEEADLARGWAAEIRDAINAHGWDGAWFSIAFSDEGRRIGTHTDAEGQVFLNPQSWSVISQCASPERLEQAMAAVDEHLDSWVGPHLLWPPFTRSDRSIGSLTGFHPGTCENASCYCHAASFKVVADCMLGRADAALATLLAIMPGGSADRTADEPTCPPFALTNSRMGAFHPHDAGKHGATWITGTISWFFQALGQYILGVRPTLTGLRIDPCVPADWDGFAMRRLYRGAWYDIQVSNRDGANRGVRRIVLDGRQIDGDVLPILDGGQHEVFVEMGHE